MQQNIKVSAPGKIILSGEHSVVYGCPAIATAVDKRITINDKEEIYSDIPIGAGMGSSAAFAVAMSAVKIGKLDLEKINSEAYKMEKTLHGNPSGVDNTVVTYGGFLWFRKESENFKIFKQIHSQAKLPIIHLLNTGKPIETTKEMVESVAAKLKKDKVETSNTFKNMENVTKEILRLLVGDSTSDFGELIHENEKLLEELDVVSDSTKSLIRKIEKIGGFAKISGAGGKKDGSGMILIYHKDMEKVNSFAKQNELNLMSVKLGEEGVRTE
jgi:mevalonate kinase